MSRGRQPSARLWLGKTNTVWNDAPTTPRLSFLTRLRRTNRRKRMKRMKRTEGSTDATGVQSLFK